MIRPPTPEWRATSPGVPRVVAVALDVDDVAMVQQAINQRRRHHLVAENSAPVLEALVGRLHRGGAFVARFDQLEEQYRPVTRRPGHRTAGVFRQEFTCAWV